MRHLQTKSWSGLKKKMWNIGKRILEIKHTENISYPQARKLTENSVVSATYANIAKPVNNSTKNQEMIHYEMINLIKELKTLIELLRESLTNLISKPHAEPNPKKNLQPQINETEYKKNSTQTTTNPKHPYYHYQIQQSPSKKIG